MPKKKRKTTRSGKAPPDDVRPSGTRVQQALTAALREAIGDSQNFSELERQLKELAQKLGLNETAWLARRQIQKLVQGVDIPLRSDQLQLLDEFLRRNGNSLASVFAHPFVVTGLSERGHLTLIMGSRPDRAAQRIDLSRWDLRAARQVLNAVDATGRHVHVAFEDVILRPDPRGDFVQKQRVDAAERWFHCLDDPAHSKVCIGSPKVCHAAEVMLARMFDVEPFQPLAQSQQERCPFFFVWPRPAPGPERDHRGELVEEEAPKLESAFLRDADQLRADERYAADWIDTLQPKSNGKPSTTVAFWHKGLREPIVIERERVPTSSKKQREWKSYGIIAAQRRPGNHLWVCVAGLTGPATLAAAQMVHRLTADLTPVRADGLSRTAWAVVEADIIDQSERTFRIDERRIKDQRFVGETRYYQPE